MQGACIFREGDLRADEKVGVNVNKEELIKALAYDRGQYEKGYKAGVRDFVKKLEKKVQHYPYYLYGLVKAVPLEDIYEILMETVGENTFTKVEHNSLCETETFEGMVGKHEEV